MINFLNHLLFKNRFPTVTIILSILIMTFAGVIHPLVLPDEGRYAGIALDMLQSGSYSTPIINSLPFFHKPILFYYITELNYSVFGVNIVTARSSSILAGIIILLTGNYFLRKNIDKNLANLYVVIMTTTLGIFVASQYANTDFLVAAMITASVVFAVDAVWAREQNKSYKISLYLMFIFVALGFLAKGLIGILLPGLIVLAWLLLTFRFKQILFFFNPIGIVIFLVISLPWIIAMQIQYPGFFDYYIVYQHFTRFLDTGFNNSQPIWFYLPIFMAVSLPWTFGLLYFFKFNKNSPILKSQASGFYPLMIIWIVCILTFFSIPNSKLVGYVLPSLAPLMMILARIIYVKATPQYLLSPVVKIESKQTSEKNDTDLEEETAENLEKPISQAQTNETVSTENKKINKFNFAIILFLIGLIMELGLFIASPFLITVRSTYKLKEAVVKKDPALVRDINNYQVYAIGYFPYDFNFNFQRRGPMNIVLDWDNPERVIHDNWIKEIHDASKFEPELGKKLLVVPQELKSLICNSVKPVMLVNYEDHLKNYLSDDYAKFDQYKVITQGVYSLYAIDKPQESVICQN